MVRTRSDLKGMRVGTKASRKMPASSSPSSSGSGRSKKYEGGNSYFPRETPPWQKEITKFFPTAANGEGSSGAGSSTSGGCDLDCDSASCASESGS